MTAVDVQTANDSVQVGMPKTLFQTGVRSSIFNEDYDVTRDGRFLVVDSVVESTALLVLVTNWDVELRTCNKPIFVDGLGKLGHS
jgi:hypothetical protein